MRNYSNEFKEEAVKLVLSSGKTIVSVSSELGVCSKTLGNWVRLYRGSKNSTILKSTPDLRDELLQLRRENKRLTMERDILKKAVGICMNELPSDTDASRSSRKKPPIL